MSEEFFRNALSRFMKDSANGGAIRHLHDLGYSVAEIKKELLFPAKDEDIQKVIDEYEKEKNSPEDAYEIVKVQNAFGKISFQKRPKKKD
ncbi:MAG: hypothetical protein K6F30_07900 [Lachnospiraceae bacterium]|nr:hypothetical protein [Lachnospiraceae bacterium]